MYTAMRHSCRASRGVDWPYDVSQSQHSLLLWMAGTEKTDAGDGIDGSDNVGIAPLFSLQENYEKISNGSVKFMARRSHARPWRHVGDGRQLYDSMVSVLVKRRRTGAVRIFRRERRNFEQRNWQDVILQSAISLILSQYSFKSAPCLRDAIISFDLPALFG